MSKNNYYADGQKLLIDIFKHLTTLSTGSILLMATFLKDIFDDPSWGDLIPFTFGALVVSTIFSVAVMILLANSVLNGSQSNNLLKYTGIFCVLIAVLSFIIGIILLSSFSIKNF
tara:strand:- start:241 stop:585 length:345 start_codon:yes stop_codon:yes gene_type:complete